MTQFIIGGQSHAYAFGLESRPADALSEVVTITSELDGLVGGWPRSKEYWDHLAAEGRDKTILVSWFGSCPAAHFAFAGKPKFDFMLNAKNGEPVNREYTVVPESLIRDVISIHGEELISVLGRLKSDNADVILICPPPPKGNSPDAVELLHKQKHFSDLLSGDDTLEMNDERVLAKVWTLMQTMQAEAASTAQVKFIPFPEKCKNEKGLLAQQYWGKDYTHANSQCANVVLEEIKNA